MGTRRDRAIGTLAAAAVAAVGLAGFGAGQADAGLIIDLRAVAINGVPIPDQKHVSPNGPGDVVSIQIFARVYGSDAVNDEGLQSISGSIYSNGELLGNLINAATVAPFNALGSQNGSQQDIDSDGDLDIGSIPNGARPATNSLYFLPRSASVQDGSNGTLNGTPIPGTNPAAEEWLVGTVNFIVTGGNGMTWIDFVRRRLPNGENDIATSVWFEEGALRNGTSPYDTNPVLIGAIPEPSGLALTGLAALGLLARRKRE